MAPVAGGRDGSGGPQGAARTACVSFIPLSPPPPAPFPSAPVLSLPCQPQTSHFIHPPDMQCCSKELGQSLAAHLVFLGIVPTAHDFRNANGFACRFSGRCQGRRERQRGMLRFYQNQFSCPGEDGKQLLSLRKTILFKPQDHVVATSYLPEWKVTLRSYHLSCRRTD